MDIYDRAAESAARDTMRHYSTSFGMASRLFDKHYRQDIYNIYGLVRIADEIVDGYQAANKGQLLNELEAQCYQALKDGFSANQILHAFQLTALKCGIGRELIEPFFASMRMDVKPEQYHPQDYESYIYGSAEVVGLMCLKVFCAGDQALYEHLLPGARALGAAFQKVNFLRDLAADYNKLGRYYFPLGSYPNFDEATKDAIITDINEDFKRARAAIPQLPRGARPAVYAAYRYYQALLNKLTITPAPYIKTHRIRIPNSRKLALLGGATVRSRLMRSARV